VFTATAKTSPGTFGISIGYPPAVELQPRHSEIREDRDVTLTGQGARRATASGDRGGVGGDVPQLL
jgi:hypothetical protein